jgi:hypothetical protein
MAAVLGAGMLFLPPRWQDILLVVLVAVSTVLFAAIVVLAHRVRVRPTGEASRD